MNSHLWDPRTFFSPSRVQAVGEPPLFLAAAVFFAIKEAVGIARAENGCGHGHFALQSPATSERIRMVWRMAYGVWCMAARGLFVQCPPPGFVAYFGILNFGVFVFLLLSASIISFLFAILRRR